MLYSVTDYIMVSDLGEVRVQVEQEGAQDAAEQIGDAAGESDAGGQGQGGGIGGLLGGISTKLAGILGFVAFLASLKPIQELLSGIQRFFSVALLPLIALITFLKPVLQKLLRFIGDLDFDNLLTSLINQLSSALENALVQLDIVEGFQKAESIVGDIGTFFVGNEDTRSFFSGIGGTRTARNVNKQSYVSSLFNEQSPTAMKQNASESTAKETSRNKAGPE